MILSDVDTIFSISNNCLSADPEPDGIVFNRFTEKQFSAYASSAAGLLRSKCPSGVCLDFYTDSDYIGFEFAVRGMVRNWLYFDVYVNDVFAESFSYDNAGCGFYDFYYRINKKYRNTNRLTVYLPHLADLTFKNIEISDGAFLKKDCGYSGNLLCLGDSITQGMDALHPSSAYPVQLARYFKMNLLNQGVGGYIFDKLSLDCDMPYKPEIITVAYGTNDWGRYESVSGFKQSCSEYISLLSCIYENSHIFVITPIWRSDINTTKPSGSLFEISDCIMNVCRAWRNVTVIDGTELVPNIAKYFGDRTVHPNDEGFLHYSINLIRHISNWMNPMKTSPVVQTTLYSVRH